MLENNLKNLIAENQKAAIWNESIVPIDPVDLAVPDVSLPEALKTAMENRPELQQSNVQSRDQPDRSDDTSKIKRSRQSIWSAHMASQGSRVRSARLV